MSGRDTNGGWFALPHAALAVAGDEGALGVLDLYRRSHLAGWGWLAWTERELAAAWRVNRRVVRRVVEALEAAELVLVERAGPGERRASRLRVIPPHLPPAAAMVGNQSRNQTRTTSEVASPDVIGRVTVAPEPEPEPVTEPSRAEEIPAPERKENQISADQSAVASARVREADPGLVAELAALQERDEPAAGMHQLRDIQAIERALLRGVRVEDLRSLWAWSGVSDHPSIAGCRTGGWRRWGSLLREPRAAERLLLAAEWEQAGRPAPAPPARPDRLGRGRAAAPPLDPAAARRALVAALVEGRSSWALPDEGENLRAWSEAIEQAGLERAAEIRALRECPLDLMSPERLRREAADSLRSALHFEALAEPPEWVARLYGAELVAEVWAELAQGAA